MLEKIQGTIQDIAGKDQDAVGGATGTNRRVMSPRLPSPTEKTYNRIRHFLTSQASKS